jgi:HSP20 family protein
VKEDKKKKGMVKIANNMIPRRSDLFDMTPFNFFEDFGRNFFEGFKGNMVKTDIHETDTEYLLEAELPGIPKENIQINYENGVLTIEGKHQTDTQTEDDKGNLVRSERSFSSVRRQFAIRNVREEDIKAEYKDGILKVTLPKSAEKLERKTAIPIE